jgi:mRNA interferase MazF
MSYEPEAGDLIWVDLDPRVGREQSGRRPALVVSPGEFWKVTGLAMICPITKKIRPFPTSVVLPEGLKTFGEILISNVRCIDTEARCIEPVGESVPLEILTEVRLKIGVIAGIEHALD